MFSASQAAWGAWWILLFAAAFMFSSLVRSGKVLRMYHPHKEVSRKEATQLHKRAVTILTGLTLVGFIGIETAIIKVGGLWGNPRLLIVHLILAACTVLAFVTVRFFYTGVKTPHYHRKLVYAFMTFYGALFVTGSMLIAEKFAP